MEYDYERAEVKRKELESITENAMLNFSAGTISTGDADKVRQIATEVIKQLAKISPPEKPQIVMKMLRLNEGGFGNARSIKPGNIILNMPNFIAAMAGGTLTVSGAIGSRWSIILAAIVLWKELWSSLNIELSEREAATLWALWKYADESKCVPNEGLLEKVNSELASTGRSPISQLELDKSLERLEKVSCIQKSNTDSSKWWLREWIRINYE